MKKKLFSLLALSAIVIGGCTKSEIDDGTINSTNTISFETSANKLTKAPVLDNNFVEDEAFGVFAYYTKTNTWANAGLTEPNFMNNQEVSYNGSVWEYTPLKYWPNTTGEMISFFGYMPFSDATTASVASGSTLPQIEFTQTMNAKTMLDLTVAQALNQKKSTSAVVLPFNHILTRLNFKGRVDHNLNSDFGLNTTSTNVYVTDIKVLGKGNNSGSKMLSKATYMLADGTTSNGAWDYTNQEVANDDLDVNPILKATDYTVGSTSEVISGVLLNQDGDAATAQPLLQDDEYLFFIPTSENGVESEDDIKFTVSYTVVTKDVTIENDIAKSESTVILSMPNGTLKSEVAYNIIMTFGLDKVVVDAEAIEGWEPNPEEEVYTVVKGEAQTVDKIEAMITDALDNSKDAVIDYNQAPTETLDININTTNASASNSIRLNLIQQTGYVNITTTANYAGPLTINAPKATVTVNGGAYENLTVWTASNTLKIAEGTTVNGLTINAGNVQVYGTLEGTITAGKELTSSIITVMPDATYSANTAGETKIKVNETPTETGIYYSLDNGEWLKYTSTTDVDGTTPYTTVKFITVGEAVINNSKTVTATFNNTELKSVDLSGATCGTDYGYWEGAPTNTKLEEFYYYKNLTSISGTLAGVTTLKKVVLPENCVSVGGMFKGCTSLETINLEKITTIYASAFSGCTSLKSVDLRSVTDLEHNTFYNCTSLEDVTFGDNITTIRSNCFYGCTSLKYLDLKNVTTISESQAFQNSGLVEVKHNGLLTSIGKYSFRDCKSLEKIDLSSVTTLGGATFYRCSSLKDINTDFSNITSAGSSEFSGCTSLGIDNVVFNSNITSIIGGFFQDTKIKSITLHDGITSIATSAFRGCSNLTGDIVLPSSLSSLGLYAFMRTAITSIDFTPCTELTYIPSHLLFESVGCKTIKGLDSDNIVDIHRAAFFVSPFEELFIPNNINLNSNDTDSWEVGDDGIRFGKMPNLEKIEFEGGGEPFTLRSKDLTLNPALKEVIFPSNLLGFTSETMSGCPMLSTIICKADKVPAATQTDFGYIDAYYENYYTGCNVISDKILYVPADLVDDYQSPLMADGTENYWKTILQDKCGFKVVSIDSMPAKQ